MNTHDGELEERLRRYYQATLGPPPDPEQVRKQVTMRLERIGDHIGDNQTGEMHVSETNERSTVQRNVVTRDLLRGAFSPGPRRTFAALVATLLVLAMAGSVFGWVASHRGSPRVASHHGTPSVPTVTSSNPPVTDGPVLPGIGPTYQVNGLQMLSDTDGWAIVAGDIGSQYQTGIVLHFNGYRWSVATTLAHAEPLSISMISATEGWIAGNTLTYSAPPTASTFRPNEVPFLVHYIGGRWVQESPPLGLTLGVIRLEDPCVTMVTANFGWATVYGSDLQYRIALYHDGIWTNTDFPGIIQACVAVSFTSPTDAWAIGSPALPSPSLSLGPFWHYTSGHWVESKESKPPVGIITNIGMSSSSAGWAIGNGLKGTATRSVNFPLLYQYNGVSWRQVTVPADGPLSNTLCVVSPTEFWAVGAGLVPGGQYTTPPPGVAFYQPFELLHYTNGQWSYVQAPAGFSNTDGSCSVISTDDVWIGGTLDIAGKGYYEAALAHYTNGQWTLYK